MPKDVIKLKQSDLKKYIKIPNVEVGVKGGITISNTLSSPLQLNIEKFKING